jgi:hypothetical protein
MPSPTERDPSILFRIRSSLACVPCRSRHVKCDGKKPNCVRCEADGRSCHYLQSKRGLKYKILPTNSSEDGVPEEQLGPDSTYNQTTSVVTRSLPPQNPATETPRVMDVPQSQISGCQSSERSKQSAQNHCHNSSTVYLDLYYNFFHHAHPYVLPRRRFDTYLRTNRSQVGDLLVVLEFIASTYTPEGQNAQLKKQAIDTMSRHDLPLTGFTVQALLLLAISVHCCNGFEIARSLMDRAISIALEIGMQFSLFAAANGNGDPVLQESWRRTWWGLYVVDGVFEVIRRSTSFIMWKVEGYVDLPCEEKDYDAEVRVSLEEI